MTMQVPDLAATLRGFDRAYVITIGPDGAPHVVAANVELRDGILDIDTPGSTTYRNVGRSATVTLLWPPSDPTGHSLIVDGTAEHFDAAIRITPTRAILHRQATTPDDGGCGGDCGPVSITADRS